MGADPKSLSVFAMVFEYPTVLFYPSGYPTCSSISIICLVPTEELRKHQVDRALVTKTTSLGTSRPPPAPTGVNVLRATSGGVASARGVASDLAEARRGTAGQAPDVVPFRGTILERWKRG